MKAMRRKRDFTRVDQDKERDDFEDEVKALDQFRMSLASSWCISKHQHSTAARDFTSEIEREARSPSNFSRHWEGGRSSAEERSSKGLATNR
jgi:hypothetical protein